MCSCELEQPTLRNKNGQSRKTPTKRFAQAMEWPSTPRTISSITSARRSRTAQPSVGNSSFGLRSGGDSVTGTPQTPKAPPSNPLFLSSPNGQHIPGQRDAAELFWLSSPNRQDNATEGDPVVLFLSCEMNPFEFVGEQEDCGTVAFCALQMPPTLLASMEGRATTDGSPRTAAS
jgi:hypothetical protein